ncbi:MAG: peptidylprolyl isomerase, partial [Rhodospirillales bacterium]
MSFTSGRRAARLSLLVFALAVSALTPPASAQTRGQGPAGIAAVVNESIITAFDVEERIDLVLAGNPNARDPEVRARLRPQIMRSLIDESLKYQEAVRLDIIPSDDQITQGMAQLASQNKLTPEQLERKIEMDGGSFEALKIQMRNSIAWQGVINRHLRSEVNVTEPEITARMNEIEASKGQPENRVAEIFLAVDNPSEEQEIYQQILRIHQALRDGNSFRKLAENFSQSASAAVGGDLGWIRYGVLDPILDDTIRSLDQGQASGPVRTDSGYHILYLIQRRTSRGLGLGGDPSVNLKQIFLSLPEGSPPEQATTVSSRAESIAAQATNCDTMDQLAQQTSSPLSGDLGDVKISALPEAIRETVNNLEIGKVSAPVRTDTGIAVLMVCGRTEADTETARAQIRGR